jgi:hypothetical protein
LEIEQGCGSGDVWLPRADRAIQRGRERQCRFRLLDPYLVYRADLLPDDKQAPFPVRISDVRIPYPTGGYGVHPGETFDLDYSLMYSLGRTRRFQLQAGPAGYEQRQTTAKTGPGISLAASEERYAINSLGFAVLGILPKRISVGLKYFKEFADRATFQGYSLQVVASIGF